MQHTEEQFSLQFYLICTFHICLSSNSGCSLNICEKLHGWNCLSSIYIWGTALTELLNIASKELSGIKRSRWNFENSSLLSTFKMINKMCLQNTFGPFFWNLHNCRFRKLHAVTTIFSGTLFEPTYTRFDFEIFLNLPTLIFTFSFSVTFFYFEILSQGKLSFCGLMQPFVGLDIYNSGLTRETLLPACPCFMRFLRFIELGFSSFSTIVGLVDLKNLWLQDKGIFHIKVRRF